MTGLRAAAAALLLGTAACDPCLGVVNCTTEPHRRVSGQVIDGANGAAARDVVVRMIAVYDIGADSVATITDNRGLFALTLPPRPDTPQVMRIRVLPPDQPGYTVDSVHCQALTRRGDGCVLEPVMKAPRLSGVLQFRYRQALELPATGVNVTFRQTGGTSVLGRPGPEQFSGTTDAAGNLQFFGDTELFSTSMDAMVGDLTVELPPQFGTMTTAGFRIPPRYLFSDRAIMVVPVGPSLAYTVVFTDSATGTGLGGIEVLYDRIGGIATAPASLAVTSASDGVATVGLRPLAQGVVDATLTMRARGQTTVVPVSLATFDADTVRVAARFAVGMSGALHPIALPPT